MSKIPLVETPELKNVKTATDAYINLLISGKLPEDTELKNIAFDELLEAIYGKDIWKWIEDNKV